MQRYAAWLLEKPQAEAAPTEPNTLFDNVRTLLLSWIAKKGADATLSQGSFIPEDGQPGKFTTQEFSAGIGRTWTVRLEEGPPNGRLIVTTASISITGERLAAFVTLESGSHAALLRPLDPFEPKSPHLIKDLIHKSGPWYHGNSRVHTLRAFNGTEDGENLADEIQSQNRTLPTIVLSSAQGLFPFPGLERQIAADLAGLANVVTIDDSASWALTNELGRSFCCHSGAIRLFWPNFSPSQSPFSHPLSTPGRILARGSGHETNSQIAERFRKFLRERVFRVSALSVQSPNEIGAIRDAHRTFERDQLLYQVKDNSEYDRLWQNYESQIDALRTENEKLKEAIQEQRDAIQKGEDKIAGLQWRLKEAGGEELETPEFEAEPPSVDDLAPKSGEYRYYKKTGSSGPIDRMLRVQDCGHKNWQPGHSADKARKGIAKVEDGRDDWQALAHCAECTGGGMWRVHW